MNWLKTMLLTCIIILGFSAAPILAGTNMLGRQSQNEGMLVVPAPGKVVVDGDLEDWDWSGRIWVFADKEVRSRYSVEAAAMWDKENLYLAAKWKDPTPMFSLIDPDFEASNGWKSDSWQMRVITDRTLWITTWYFTPKKQAVMTIDYWKGPTSRDGMETILLKSSEGGTLLGQGVEMAYQKEADEKGFRQEIKIPWKLIYKTVPEIKPGMVLKIGHEFLWGDPSGKNWPIHRYADNMQPGNTTREFFWSATSVWGDAKLVAEGNVPVRQYIDEADKIAGTIPIRVTIPKDAARFTIVIEDENGNRIRNLAGDCDPIDYTVSVTGNNRLIEVKWDCLDDKGNLVAPGTYRIRGLTHGGLSANYEMTFYNPGTPPWATADGKGSWTGCHTPASGVATSGEWTVVATPVVEGGSGVMVLGPTGQKQWGDNNRGATLVAADKDYVYAYVTYGLRTTGELGGEAICRYDLKTGNPKPFIRNGQPRQFELTLPEILGTNKQVKVLGMAAGNGKLALSLSTGKIVILDAASADILKEFTLDNPGALAFSRDGKLYALLGGSAYDWDFLTADITPLTDSDTPRGIYKLLGGKVHQVDLQSGFVTPIPTPGVLQASALAVDNDGNILVADIGPDSQVKAFTPDGKIVYTCGKKGGRPIRGAFDEQAMLKMSSIAVDNKGQVWVVESWDYPRRISVWGKDGKLVRDYLGGTRYAGGAIFLDPEDPSLGYCGPIEFHLDRETGKWKVTQVLWVPDRSQGESFIMGTELGSMPHKFTSTINGKPHKYLYINNADFHPYSTGHVVFMERDGKWQPVAAVSLAAHISGRVDRSTGRVVEPPSGELAGINAYDICFWNDTNRDGKVQRDECEIVPAQKPGSEKERGIPALPLQGATWPGRIDTKNFAFYVGDNSGGIVRYAPIGFTDDGAPRYGSKGVTRLELKDSGVFVPVPEENLLLLLSYKGYAKATTGMLGIDASTQKIRWSYPNLYPGVHGSHNAPMPKPGLLIGPLTICGVAKVNEEVGNVFMLRGNLGQDFFMTTDGLFVGALFRDGRIPSEQPPANESLLKGMPMENFSNGAEPFNGWFGKQADGKIRMTTTLFAREAAMVLQINGLETIKRFDGGTIELDMQAIVLADAENAARIKAGAKPKSYEVTRLASPPTIDGNPTEWANIALLTIQKEGQPERATVKTAYDESNLYLLYEVQDASPWLNTGKDYTALFKTGDSVDFQLSTDPNAKPHTEPQPGDLRLLIAPYQGKPAAVLMVPVDKSASAEKKAKYTSPVGTKIFDRVEILSAAKIAVKVNPGRYTVEAAIPWTLLGIVPRSGMALKGDFGFISSDAQGMINTARTYWANQNTGLVSDLPMESWLYPDSWGDLIFK